jgi:nitroreductase
MPETIKVILGRKSVRHFTGESVSKSQLDIILKTGMSAPSAVNKQPWELIVVTERKILDILSAGLPYARMLSQAGAAIIICAIPQKANDGMLEYAVIDCSLAGENILIAVESLELGAVWTACYPRKDRMEFVRKTLNIPTDVIPLNVIPIGVPTGEDLPKDKWKPENIHWGKW